MGYQESSVKFENVNTLKNELVRYKFRDRSHDCAHIAGIVRANKNIVPFKKGEFALVITGERYPQRNTINLKEEMGIENAEDIAFIDSVRYVTIAQRRGVDLDQLLDENFHELSEDEVSENGFINPYQEVAQ
jgi:hypothetical protein